MAVAFAAVEQAIRRTGLQPRGGFVPEARDQVPETGPGVATRTLVLVGNAGPQMWRSFAAERDPSRDSLDAWSQAKVTGLAAELGATALFPFTRPYLPFQRWAQRADACHASPLGMFVHPDYGLWHGYRGALAFAEALAGLPPRDDRPSPCTTCAERPCLRGCPVNAFSAEGYDVAACVAHISTEAGRDCIELGCRARRACPVGVDYRYEPAQARFHMRAFLAAHSNDGDR